ncbi:MAG: alpha/beta fold hydrolase [Pseudomonadota bacterium]
MRLRVYCLASATLLATLAAAAGFAQSQPAARPPAASFFENSPFSMPRLSPNGRLLAVIAGSPGKKDGLAVIDLATSKLHATARFANADIGKFHWVNDQRLIFDTTDKLVAPGDREYGPGLYAANFDGSAFKQLAERRGDGSRHARPGSSNGKLLAWNTFLMPQAGAQQGDSVFVLSPDFSSPVQVLKTDLLELDTVTGRFKKVSAPGDTGMWLLDHAGQPRLTSTMERDQLTMHQRELNGQWKALVTFNPYKADKAAFSPLAYGPDGTLYATTSAGGDKVAVHTVDTTSGAVSAKALITLADYDFLGSLMFSKGKLLGFRALTDAESTMWFDPAMKAVQEDIDKLLTNTVNLISVPARPETPWVLVESYSDVQPKTLRLYNTETRTLNPIGSTRPAIDPAQMGTQEMISYKARDGLTIPALLTMPPGARKAGLPMVVLVHGGPWVRGSQWGWRAETQFLASRGYAVLEPDFRGSTGYGNAHFRAGFKQWGLAMQHDVADGAKWAIAKGIVDPARICIAGSSYGGYATLMGLVNDPDLFKCGINWVGVTDINLMYTGHWSYQSDLSSTWKKYGMPEMIGDPVKDAAQLAATSPLQQAARIKQPLLMAYGDNDKRVPLYHGNKFYSAVKETNKDVELVVYPGEGHGWQLADNRINFWNRVEKFLDRHIGKP